MTPIEIGLISVVAMVFLIYSGVYIPVVLGMTTMGANAIFTKVSVPQMIAQNYNTRFAVGVVAGSSVLGMIIPPSAMLIIDSFVAEQSVGDMFLAGVIPGILLAIAYVAAIWFM